MGVSAVSPSHPFDFRCFSIINNPFLGIIIYGTPHMAWRLKIAMFLTTKHRDVKQQPFEDIIRKLGVFAKFQEVKENDINAES